MNNNITLMTFMIFSRTLIDGLLILVSLEQNSRPCSKDIKPNLINVDEKRSLSLVQAMPASLEFNYK